jgi:N utilization substance protein B
MQSIYAMHQSGSDVLEKQEKFLQASIENIEDLYLILLSSLIEIRKKEIQYIEIAKQKHLATPEERNPNLRFVTNPILVALDENTSIQAALEKRKINNWQINDDTIIMLLQVVKQSELYEAYMSKNTVTFEDHSSFVIEMFSELIAPNEKLYSYLEDFKLTWVDDIPVVNTLILKQLKQITESLWIKLQIGIWIELPN